MWTENLATNMQRMQQQKNDVLHKCCAAYSQDNVQLIFFFSLYFSPPTGDDTYHDIFRDFSQMASNNPEKLKRRSADMKWTTWPLDVNVTPLHTHSSRRNAMLLHLVCLAYMSVDLNIWVFVYLSRFRL